MLAPSHPRPNGRRSQPIGVKITNRERYEFDITTPGEIYHVRMEKRDECNLWLKQLFSMPALTEDDPRTPRSSKRDPAAALKNSVHQTAADL